MRQKRGLVVSYIKLARHKIVLYRKHNERRLDYPDIFFSGTPVVESPLHWSGDAVHLKELLTALDLTGMVTDDRREKIPFTKLVSTFSQVFHIELGDSREVKRIILNRKLHPDSFLDALSLRLRESPIE